MAGPALIAIAASTVSAQVAPTPSTLPNSAVSDSSADSVLARLQRAEEAIALLRQQLAAQAASATQTESRVRFDLGGRVIVNAFHNSWRVNNADVPQFARPDTNAPGRLLRGGVGAALRQTTLRGSAFAPSVMRGSFTGDIEVDFYGGQAASPGGRHFPVLRMRTARGVMRWSRAEIMFGQDVPIATPVEPVSVAAIGVPEFGTAGNLWLWLPQVRLSLEQPVGPVRVGVDAGALSPTNGDPAGLFDTGVDVAERSRLPVFQGRVRARWGDEDREGEIGFGVHRGWLAAANNDTLVDSEALTASLVLPVWWLELRGEAFIGKALRGLGGGGIAQGINGQGVPIRTRGGWAQVNVRPVTFVTIGGGCGADTPNRDDLPTPTPAAVAGTRLRNVVCEAHVITRPDGPIVAGVTMRRTRTSYGAPIGPIVNRTSTSRSATRLTPRPARTPTSRSSASSSPEPRRRSAPDERGALRRFVLTRRRTAGAALPDRQRAGAHRGTGEHAVADPERAPES
jgi:hypothetical protein